jgi:membrane protein DedA with SNARE-associated domain
MAGVGEMSYKRYLLVDSLAVIGWINLIVLAGYFLGVREKKHLDYIVAGIAIVSMLPMAIGIASEVLTALKKRIS